MGNGDGIAIRAPWDRPTLFNVNLPFRLDGEKAIVERLHASMLILRGRRDESIEIRIDYPDRPHAPDWKQGDLPAGDVFYLPIKHYTKEELIKAIQKQHHEGLEIARQREVSNAKEEVVLVERRSELDSIVGSIAQQIC